MIEYSSESQAAAFCVWLMFNDTDEEYKESV